MTGQCCVVERRGSRRRAAPPEISKVTASILPAVLLVFLPKCPLCLAAWLTIATGVSFSASGATWVRGMVVMFWLITVVLAAAPIMRRLLNVNS